MLHEFLTRHRDEIVQRCEERYRRRHPDLSRDELLGTIPSFIDELIKAERSEAGLPEESRLPLDARDARGQGEKRFQQGSRIQDVVADYGAVSQVIGELAIEHDLELDSRSYRVLNECIDAGLEEAIETYHGLTVARDSQEVAESVGVLAHELRNALASAVLAYGFIRAAMETLESGPGRILERSLNQLEALVAQMIAVARLKSGVPPAMEPVDLAQLIQDVDAGAPHERDIRVDLVVPVRLLVIGDQRLLASALANLLQNALKFTRTGGVIRIRAERHDNEIRIDVEDECGGLDMPPETLFQPFVQHDRQRRGIGLGLVITRKAIEVHRGSLSVRNIPSKGCVFTILLPVT